MLRNPSSRQILGTRLWLLAAPMCLWGQWKLRKRHLMHNPVPAEAIRGEWTAVEFCFTCNQDTLHTFIEFVDEPVVESECNFCKEITERKDLLS